MQYSPIQRERKSEEDLASGLVQGAPPAPATLEEAGLDLAFMLRLAVKCAVEKDTVTASYLTERTKLPKVLVNQLIKELVKLSLLEARGLASDDIKSDIRYSLTLKGLEYTHAATRLSEYVGPAPVSLDAYCRQIDAQSVRNEHVTRQDLKNCLEDLVVSDTLVEALGPALNASGAMLLYGPPGNGKTSIAERLPYLFRQTVWLPYAIEIGGHVIRYFDEGLHEPINTSPEPKSRIDQRWVECRRPVIKTGGELTLDMLDLTFNEIAKVYEAPVHVKASGGVFILDDFGRQQVSPQTLINRWIVPLERGYDFLTLHTGRKFKVPFDELVIISTNIAPRDLVDEAGLRRLKHKIHIGRPNKRKYFEIFKNYALREDITVIESDLSLFYDATYGEDALSSCYHPKYLLDYVRSYCEFNSVAKVASMPLLERAWASIFALDHADAG